jgi:dTDP-4-dehydrorhamnose reductase
VIAILGSQGQVGSALKLELKRQGRAFCEFSRDEVDLSYPKTVIKALDQASPSAVINAAAYTAVDLAQQEEELAFRINADAPGLIATWCAKRGLPFVHYSTDYVFSGQGTKPWLEEDPTGPLSIYGKSKLAGEEAVTKAGARSLIFRTSWVYDATGANFLNTMLRLGGEKTDLRVVSDQVGAPTFAGHLADATFQAFDQAERQTTFPTGIYHACNTGETNWNEFAREIFHEARQRGIPLRVKSVMEIATSEYPTPAKRPLNSRLNTTKLFETFGVRLPDWRQGLKTCMEQKK